MSKTEPPPDYEPTGPQGPQGLQYQGPPGPQYQGPPGPQYQGPPGPQYQGPPGPQYQGPPGPQYQGPPGPQYQGPPGPGAPVHQYPGHTGPQYQQPMTQQPMAMGMQQQTSSTTVVVAGNMGPVVKPLRGWSTDICGCFEDPLMCLAVWFCTDCYGCHLASKAGETCCLPCCVPAWLISLRAHTRGKHNIQGSILDDCCKVACCYPCAMCQLSREIDNIQQGRAPP